MKKYPLKMKINILVILSMNLFSEMTSGKIMNLLKIQCLTVIITIKLLISKVNAL